MASADLAARLVLMSAYLYYERASPVLSDSEYDRLTDEVCSKWCELEPIRQWQLGNPEELRATAHHSKITVLTEKAACAWYFDTYGRAPDLCYIGHWRFRKGPKRLNYVRYATLQG
jgi:hypothetical protein